MGGIGTLEAKRPVAGTDVHFYVRAIKVGKEGRPSPSLSRSVTLTVIPSTLSILATIDLDATICLIQIHFLFDNGHRDKPF